MLLVYIASPYSEGDRQFNLDRQNEIANVLLNEGCAPFPPLLIGEAMEQMQSRTWQEWMEVCLTWVEKCDVVLRLEGRSVGADAECAYAETLGIPVVFSLDDLLKLQG